MKQTLIAITVSIMVCSIALGVAAIIKHNKVNHHTMTELTAKYGPLTNYQPKQSFLYLTNGKKAILCIYDSQKDTYQVITEEKIK